MVNIIKKLTRKTIEGNPRRFNNNLQKIVVMLTSFWVVPSILFLPELKYLKQTFNLVMDKTTISGKNSSLKIIYAFTRKSCSNC